MPKVVDAEQRRTELTDAAARIIARSGPEAANLRDVAAAAGLTTGALTHYFADKRELLRATFEASLAGRQSRRAGTASDPMSQLRLSLEGALPIDEDRRRHWMVTLACCSQAVADPALAHAQETAYRAFVARIAVLVAGAFGGDEAEDLAVRLIAAADGIAVQALFDPASWPRQRQLAVLDALIGGMVPVVVPSGVVS